MNGWIALHRSLLDKPIWKTSSPEQKAILITILMLASHRENEWAWSGQKFKIHPGQFICSLESLAKTAGVSVKNVRTAIKKFEKYEFLANESANNGRLITVVNWGFYQVVTGKGGKAAGKGAAKPGQSTGKAMATINNVNQFKNETTSAGTISEGFDSPEIDTSHAKPALEKDPENQTSHNRDINPDKSGQTPAEKSRTLRAAYSEEFETFWTNYPRHKEKQAAWKAWNSRQKEGYPAAELQAAARHYAQECRQKSTDEQYIKHASTFLGPNRPFLEYLEHPAGTAERSDELVSQSKSELGTTPGRIAAQEYRLVRERQCQSHIHGAGDESD